MEKTEKAQETNRNQQKELMKYTDVNDGKRGRKEGINEGKASKKWGR